jgi:hypothetical protein
VNIADAPSLDSTTGTWDFWLKTTQTGGFIGLVGKHDAAASVNGITMEMDQGHARIEVKGNGPTLLLTGTSPLNDGQWHHMALTFQSGGPAIMYVDGQVQDSGTAPTFSFNATPLRFGRMLDTFWTPYNGQLDEVQIFNRVLSAGEVQAIVNAGSAGQVKGVRGSDLAVVPTGGFTATAYAGVASPMQTVGVFTDPGGPEGLADYSATINWGDNTTPSAGTISFNSGTGVFTVQGSHPYTQVGNYTITVTLHHDTATDATATSAALVFAPVLRVAGFPSPIVAGTPGSFTVTVRDAFGATLAGYRGTVHLTSSDPQAVLPGDYTFTTADAGMHTFSATLKTAGTWSLTATDTATGASGTQAGIVVNPAAASTLLVSDFPSPTTAGAVGAVLVTAKDPYGNIATGYTGTVHLTSSDPRAQLEGDHTFTAADGGRYAFGAVLKTAGTWSLTATDTANPGLTGTQSGIVVNPAAPDHIRFTNPGTVTAGSRFPITVTVQDAFNNTVTGYTGTVHFTASNGASADYTFTSADMGQHTFTIALFRAGTVTITGTDTGTGATGSTTITVNPAAASALVVAGYPSPTGRMVFHDFTVTAYDPYGNVATGYTGTVTFTSDEGHADLPADYTFTAADAGMHTFSAAFNRFGTFYLAATDTANPGITGTQSGIQVVNGDDGSPPAGAGGGADAGSPPAARQATPGGGGSWTAAAAGRPDNAVTGYAGPAPVTGGDGQAVLPADYVFGAAGRGRDSFPAALNTPAGPWVDALDALMASLRDRQEALPV